MILADAAAAIGAASAAAAFRAFAAALSSMTAFVERTGTQRRRGEPSSSLLSSSLLSSTLLSSTLAPPLAPWLAAGASASASPVDVAPPPPVINRARFNGCSALAAGAARLREQSCCVRSACCVAATISASKSSIAPLRRYAFCVYSTAPFLLVLKKTQSSAGANFYFQSASPAAEEVRQELDDER